MSRGGILLLRIAIVAVPLGALLVGLHLAAPGMRTRLRERSLPPGYREIGTWGSFVLFSRPDNRAAPGAAEILEGFTEAVVREWGERLRMRPEGGRTELIVFSAEADLAEFGRSELGSDMDYNGGFYLPSARTIGVVGDRDPAVLVRPLFHEGTHMMLDFWVEGSGQDWSRWFDEGLASYFEASAITKDGIRPGGVDAWLVERAALAIREGRWPTLAALFAAPDAAWEEAENLLLYSKAALLTHYLLDGEGGALRDRWFALYDRERLPGPLSPRDFAEAVGDPAGIDAALTRHALRLR